MDKIFTPTVLSIAGSDTYGGAGIQVDVKTIHALGGYAFTAPTALTSQNSRGVKAVFETPSDILRKQIETILDDIEVYAVKIGMLSNVDIVLAVADMIDRYTLKNIVLDTVMVSSSGKRLLQNSAVEIMIRELFPRVDLITPNIPEVNALLHSNYKGDFEDIEDMADGLFNLGANAVLIKGGHSTNKEKAIDYFMENKNSIKEYATPRVSTTHTHGTGCILSSSIATHLASGYSLAKSIELSKKFMYESLVKSGSLQFHYRKKLQDRKESVL